MRKIYFALAMLAVPLLTTAQISLNASMAPSNGSMFIYYDANVPIPAFTFSKSGINNTWDFTTISPLPTEEDTVFIVDPATIPGSSVFPTATHAIREHDTPAFTMIQIDVAGASFLGAIGDVLGTGTNFATIATPPFTAITFPYTYGSATGGNTYFEVFATGAAIGQPTIDSVRFKSSITANHDVLAAGNIILPSGTYASILERQISTNLDSAWIKSPLTLNQWVPAPGFPTTTTDSSFYWYTDQSLQKYAHALFDDTGLHDVVFFKSTTIGLAETHTPEFAGIYPNPVKNAIYFASHVNQQSEYRFSILDVAGKEVLHGSSNTEKINVAHLVPGLYFLQIESISGQPTVHRFIKE